MEHSVDFLEELILEIVLQSSIGHFDEILHSFEYCEFHLDCACTDSSSCGEYHTLGWHHLVMCCFCIIVKGDGCESHKSENVVGDSLQEYRADSHSFVDPPKLVWRHLSFSNCAFKHFMSPDDSASHIHCSTNKLDLVDLVDLDQFA